MIKKSVFEDALIEGMQKELIKNATAQDADNLETAADYLNSAVTIFEDMGMTTHADQVLKILSKVADQKTKGLTSEKMIKNLKDHGTVFNMADDNAADDLLNLEVGNEDLIVSEDEADPDLHDFEDEID